MSNQDPPATPPPGSKPPGSTGPIPHEGRGPHDSRRAWAAGGTLFAGMMLLIAGVLAVLEGAVGIAKNSVYVRTRGNYAYKFDVSAWGWVHLILGIVAILIGLGLLGGALWARFAGIAIAGLDLIANFMFLPYQPIWSVIMIAIDTFVIWALATHHPARVRQGGAW